jgi:hypothetical protein
LRATRWWNPGWSWKVWGVVTLLLIPTVGLSAWVLAEADPQTKIDAATLGVAQANADSDVIAITGTAHTVYHSPAPLPSAATPRGDGRYTLVWFTNQTCARCQQELFVHKTMANYRGKVVFVEKATDRDNADDQLGVKDVPSFVWLDANGKELGRFGAVADDAALQAEVAKVVAQP